MTKRQTLPPGPLDGLLSPIDAAAILPGRRAPKTIRRWIKHGFSVGRVTIRLRHIRVGAQLFTREEWLLTFFEQIAEAEVAERDRRRRRAAS